MELLFIYIKESQGLKDVQFNFSPQYVFTYLKEKNEITCFENEYWDSSFWGDNTNIKNISGVVGQNGTGKTSLMRLILSSCIDEGISEDPENVIIIFRDNYNTKKLKCFHPASILIEKLPLFVAKSNSPRFNKNTFIFHSNHFDAFDYRLDISKNEFSGMQNLSTAYLLQKDKETYLNRPLDSVKFNYSLTLTLHRAMEMRRYVDFIRKYHKDESLMWLKIPIYLRILPNKEEESWVSQSNEYHSISMEFIDTFFNLSKRIPSRNVLYFTYFKASFYNFLNHVLASYGSSPYRMGETAINIIIEKLNHMKDVDELSITGFYQELASKSIFSDLSNKTYSDLIGLFHMFKEAHVSSSNDCYILDLSKRSISSFNSFFNNYFSEDRITSFVDFELSHNKYIQTTPSSGELAMLNFFSRFSSMRKSQLKNNLTVLLDEIELALHPNWQKKFLSSVISFFQKEFRNRNIQIIISSHSPFIVSDLPVECLNFLNGRINTVKQTFCANIHTLFSDAFFLKDGLVGEFAQQKVKALTSYLKEEKEEVNSAFSKETSGLLINIIGEPVLKTHLQNMWHKKFGEESPEETIETLRKEIDQLKAENKFLKTQKDN